MNTPSEDHWFNNSPVLMFIVQLDTHRLVQVNEAFAKQVGTSQARLIGRNVFELFADESKKILETRYGALLDGKQLPDSIVELLDAQSRVQMVRLTDNTMSMEASPDTMFTQTVVAPVGTGKTNESGPLLAIDLSKPLNSREMAPRRRTLLWAAIEQAAETVVLTDTSGRIEYVNPAFEKTTGYTAEEAIGANPRILKSGRQDSDFYHQMWAELVQGKTWRGSFVNKRKDGELYVEEASITPVRGEDGTITGYVAVKRDATKEALLERALQQSQRISSMGRLAGGLAHEFNNVLQIISGHLGFALDAATAGSQLEQDLLVIRNAVERAAHLTDQMLAFGRKSTLQREPLDMNQQCEKVLALARDSIRGDVLIDFKPEVTPWEVFADPGQVQQVLLNLLFNARDAVGDRGSIILQTNNVQVPPRRESPPHGMRKSTTNEDGELEPESVRALVPPPTETDALVPPGSYVTTTVTDDGIGMSLEMQNQIFEPFFTTKPVAEGAGLGLSVVQGIVAQHGGYVRVHSRLGKGTRMTVYWPATITPDSRIAPSPKSESGEPKTILVIEPNDQVRRITATAIRRSSYYDGFRIVQAATGDDALQEIEQRGQELYAVITEMEPPTVPGQDLLAEVARVNPCCALVAYVAAYPSHEDTAKLEQLGATIVPKPSSPTKLIAQIERAREDAKRRASENEQQ